MQARGTISPCSAPHADCTRYRAALDRLLPRLPEACASALLSGGSAGLEAHLAAEREAARPEFLRQVGTLGGCIGGSLRHPA